MQERHLRLLLHTGSLNAVRLCHVFDLFDRNGDGEITVDELAQALTLWAWMWTVPLYFLYLVHDT
jgi:aryl carrier-like protein